MTLLEFARGPAFQFALMVFVFGVVWRLAGIFLLRRRRDVSQPRHTGVSLIGGGLRAIGMRSLPPHELEKHIVFQHLSGYAWHIGFFVTLLLFGPHIPFFKQFLGFGWPVLPNGVVMLVGAATLLILVVYLFRRMQHPVLRQISSPDDYISLIVTMLPLITGFMAYYRWIPPTLRYEEMLALHLLSVCLLLVWFPFGKLMHLFLTFPSRFQAGALLARRGVKA